VNLSAFEDNVVAVPDLAGLKHSSLDGAAATAGSQAVKFGLQFVSQIWLARLISPAEYGLVAMVVPILSFISIISDLGIGMALVQRKYISQSQISALFWLNATISAAIALALVAISPLVGLLYREPKTVPITIVLAALLFVSTFGIHPSAILNRQMRLARKAVIDCVASVVGLTVGILTAMIGCSYWSLVYLQIANTLSSLLLTWLSAGWLPSRPRWDPSAIRTLRFGASLMISNIATYFSMSADNMIVGTMGGKVALGLYDKAYRLVVSPISQLSAPFGRVAIPLLSRLDSEPAQYASAYKRMIQLQNLICIPAMIYGIFLSRQLVHVFLGSTWSGIAPVFSWVCVGGIGSCLYGSASWLFTSQGRGREQMKWAIITSVISVASFAVGIRWGAVGVASLGALGFVLIQTPLIIWVATRTGPVGSKNVINAMMPMLLSLVITAPTIYLFSKLVHINPIIEICEGLVLTGAVYVLPIFLMSSGRELLSGAVITLSRYITRLRSSQHRTVA
jgi:PST family polysaccharide transporter